MAEEFHAGICREIWWNPTKTMFTGCNSPLYATGIADIGSFGWGTDTADIKARSNDSVFYHKPDQLQADSDRNGDSSVLIDSTLQMMGFGFSSSTTSDWNQSLLLSSSEDSSINSCQGLSAGFAMGSASYDCPSTLTQTPFEADRKVPQQQSLFNNQSINYMPSAAAYGAPSIRPPPLTKQPAGNLQFSNNTSFWNPSPPFEEKPNCSSLTTETNIDGVRNRKNSGSVMKKGSSTETPLKRPRLETPSPLPTFKVRKEKLGDRITALQQLVSPFGKTDTASVLHEAIEYIKLLHDQVIVLSTPYMKQAAAPIQQQSSDKLKDLRSRELCLVPVSSTFPVAAESPVDFWMPTFGATFR
ncbi:transcription factor bHLH112-like [Hibiscus syriacus]|uniref:transcription factor bHLH112-like n=1 Tax=Hibiscus syriacus TaxID=106335 RepID=UPI001924249F|nr:transcription factor bHLH112-like [Hibiscus syriacus]